MATDILDKLNARLIDPEQIVLTEAIAEIQRLRATVSSRGRLLVDIFNCDEAPDLPLAIRNRIETEIKRGRCATAANTVATA